MSSLDKDWALRKSVVGIQEVDGTGKKKKYRDYLQKKDAIKNIICKKPSLTTQFFYRKKL